MPEDTFTRDIHLSLMYICRLHYNLSTERDRMLAKITFLGATGTVTGSKYLLETCGKKLLIDCGLFQGMKKNRLRNWEPFPVNPAEIDAVILTHAHIDHCGFLPRLTKEGFTGPYLLHPYNA